MAKEKNYICGGVKYHFEEEEDGKLRLLSLEIWNKVFELPNGGIVEKESITSEQIADGSITENDLSDDLKAQIAKETIGEEAAHSIVADLIHQHETGGNG